MDFTTELQWLQTEAATMRDQLLAWSSINSGSFHLAGLAKMKDVLAQAFAQLGTPIEDLVAAPMKKIDKYGQVVEVPLGNLLRLRKRPEAPIQVFLCGHMDTVYGADHPFQTPRWLDDNTINGPGVTDMKGGLLVMLYALLALERSSVASQIGWEVLLTSDEEIGSYGAAPFLKEAAQRNHLGLVFEPAMQPDGTLAGARKGVGNFIAVAHGRAAHAGRAIHLGRNAIRALADFIHDVDELNQTREGVTFNVGLVEGGSASNVVPDLAMCHVDIRTVNPPDEAWAATALQQVVERINQREGINLELHGHFNRPPKPLEGKTLRLFEMVRDVAQTLGLKLQWQPSGGCCDGNNLAAAGLPVVDTLGVRGGNIHSSEEFILIDSLVERAQLTALLLMKLAVRQITLS